MNGPFGRLERVAHLRLGEHNGLGRHFPVSRRLHFEFAPTEGFCKPLGLNGTCPNVRVVSFPLSRTLSRTSAKGWKTDIRSRRLHDASAPQAVIFGALYPFLNVD